MHANIGYNHQERHDTSTIHANMAVDLDVMQSTHFNQFL